MNLELGSRGERKGRATHAVSSWVRVVHATLRARVGTISTESLALWCPVAWSRYQATGHSHSREIYPNAPWGDSPHYAWSISFRVVLAIGCFSPIFSIRV